MFVRLTRPARAKAGWFVALLYLCCVLAPGAALAFGDAASCLMTGPPAAGDTHVHHDAQSLHEGIATHQHGDGHQHHAGAGATTHGHTEHRHDGQASPGPCCTMTCIVAIAPYPPAIERPSPPISLGVCDVFQRPAGEAPPLLYRPPIG